MKLALEAIAACQVPFKKDELHRTAEVTRSVSETHAYSQPAIDGLAVRSLNQVCGSPRRLKSSEKRARDATEHLQELEKVLPAVINAW